MDERVEEVLRRHSYLDEDFSNLGLATHDLTRRWVTRCSFAGCDLRHSTLDGSFFNMCDFSRPTSARHRCAAQALEAVRSALPTCETPT